MSAVFVETGDHYEFCKWYTQKLHYLWAYQNSTFPIHWSLKGIKILLSPFTDCLKESIFYFPQERKINPTMKIKSVALCSQRLTLPLFDAYSILSSEFAHWGLSQQLHWFHYKKNIIHIISLICKIKYSWLNNLETS